MTDRAETARERFFRAYAERSGLGVDFLRKQGLDAVPCDCDYDGCEGWKVVRVKEESMIKVYEDADSVCIQLPGEYGPIDLPMEQAAELLNALSSVARLRTKADAQRWRRSQADAIAILREASAKLKAMADVVDGDEA